MRVMTITGLALLVSAGAFAQDEPARKAAVEVAARVPLEKAMKGAPYSAETIIEGSQSLADGNRINKKTTGRVYRDGEGRTRREEDRPDGSVSVSITDPVAGFSYSLDAKNKIAWKTPTLVAGGLLGKLEASQVEGNLKIELEKAVNEKLAEGAKARTPADDWKIISPAGGGGGRGGGAGVGAGGGGGGGRGRARSSNVVVPDAPLEHKTMEGVPVEGRKTTTVIPAGQVGNEQPITITSEEWRSRELNLLVLTKHSDPRSGESIYRLQNIIRAEPDQSLFMVPSDYTIKETGIRRMVEASKKH